jgi:hypothetical protein
MYLIELYGFNVKLKTAAPTRERPSVQFCSHFDFMRLSNFEQKIGAARGKLSGHQTNFYASRLGPKLVQVGIRIARNELRSDPRHSSVPRFPTRLLLLLA